MVYVFKYIYIYIYIYTYIYIYVYNKQNHREFHDFYNHNFHYHHYFPNHNLHFHHLHHHGLFSSFVFCTTKHAVAAGVSYAPFLLRHGLRVVGVDSGSIFIPTACPWKWIVGGRRSFPFGARGLFSAAFAASFREAIFWWDFPFWLHVSPRSSWSFSDLWGRSPGYPVLLGSKKPSCLLRRNKKSYGGTHQKHQKQWRGIFDAVKQRWILYTP